MPASCQTWETELLVGFWFLFCLFAGCLFFLKKKKSVPLSTTFVAVCCSVHSGICPSNMCKPGGVALAEQHKSWCTHPVLQSGVASQDSLYTYRSNKYLCLFLTKTFLPYIRDGVDSAVQPPQAVLSPCQGKAGGGPLRCSAGGDTAERSPWAGGRAVPPDREGEASHSGHWPKKLLCLPPCRGVTCRWGFSARFKACWGFCPRVFHLRELHERCSSWFVDDVRWILKTTQHQQLLTCFSDCSPYQNADHLFQCNDWGFHCHRSPELLKSITFRYWHQF